MKEKLEMKHLAPYLPYRLKIKFANLTSPYLMTGTIQNEDGRFIEFLKNNGAIRHELIINIKPILRPLTDLTKKITYNGACKVLGVLMEQWQEDWCEHFIDFGGKEHEANIESCPYDLMQLLLENHFDVFGLIEKGLAIDINTIEKL